MAASSSNASLASHLAPILDSDVAYTRKLPFSVICDLFTVINSTNNHSIKRAALEKLLSRYRLHYAYPIMRLLLPHLDLDRQTYALKESKLARVLIQILAITKDSVDAQRMINWRQPQKNAATHKREEGDFAEAVYNSLKTRCASHSTSTVASINAHLDALNTAVDSAARNQILTTMVREATAYEMKWIVRIILKDLKIGISEALIFEVFHEEATELYNITSSLFLVCNQLHNPNARTSHQGISLFHPIKPMLAGRKQPEDIGSLISTENRKFVIEQQKEASAKTSKKARANIFSTYALTGLALTKLDEHPDVDVIKGVKSNILAGKELCVVNGDDVYRKQFLENLVRNQGGSVVQSPTNKTFCALAGKVSVKVKLVEASQLKTNIVWVKWLIGSILKGSLLPLEPRFMIYAEPGTASQFSMEIDAYGDTFERPTDEATLRDIFSTVVVPWLPQIAKKRPIVKAEIVNSELVKPDPLSTKMQIDPPTVIDLDEMPDLVQAESKYFGRPWWGLFRSCIVYVDIYLDISNVPRINNLMDTSCSEQEDCKESVLLRPHCEDPALIQHSPLALTSSLLKFYGATIVDYLDIGKPLNYIIIDRSDTSRLSTLQRYVNQFQLRKQDPKIVDDKWVSACTTRKMLLDPNQSLLDEAASGIPTNRSDESE